MFKIYIKDFNQNGRIISTETLVEEVPAKDVGELKFISPIIKAEMGTVEGLDFSIQAGTKYYDAFLQMKTYVRIVYDGTTIFYGRVLTIDNNPFKATRKIRCEGPLSFLMDSPVEGKEEDSRALVTILEYMNQLINNHNNFINNETNKRFQLGEVPGQYSGSVSSDQRISNESRKFGSDSWTDTKGALEDLRSHYGGYFRVRMGALGSKLTLDWMDHYFNNTIIDQTVEVGKNILDISDVTEVDNIFTAIIPIGRTNVTTTDSTTGGSSSKQNNLYIDGKILRVPDIVGHFSDAQLNRGYHKKSDYANAISKYGMIIKTVSLTDCSTKTKLYDEACKWILNNYQGEVTKFTVKAIDMHQIGEHVTKISVGDRVKIIYPVGNEDGTFRKESVVQTCLSIQYDLYHPENNSYTFGIPANVLTKTYGLSKQKGSVASQPEKKPDEIKYPSHDKPRWRNKVAGWLMDHKFYYTGPKPFKQEYDDSGYAKTQMVGSYLYVPGEWLVYAYQPGRTDPSGSKAWVPQIDRTTTTVSENTIIKNHVLDYVMYEYGIDLRTFWPGITPDSIDVEVDPDTGDTTASILTGFWNGVTQSFDWFKVAFGKPIEDAAGSFWGSLLGFFNFGDPENPEELAHVDQNGNFNWYYIDPVTGQKVGTNTRDLAVTTVNNENFIGTVVEDGYYDSDGNTHVYKFGQAIEDWADTNGSNSKLVVAHVDGDVIRIGSERTQFSTTVATKVNGTFLSPIEFITGTDPTTGQASAIHIGAAGQASYRARWDSTKGCYVYDPNGTVTLTGDGFWDEKNLAIKGGVYTVYENNHYVSYVKSGQLVIGSNQQNTRTSILEALRTSNVIDANDSPESLATSALFVEQVNALNVRCDTLNTNKIDANNINTKMETVGTLIVRNIQGVVKNGSGGTAQFNDYYGQHYKISYSTGPDTSAEVDLRESVRYANITGPVNNVYTLHLFNAFNTELEMRPGDTMTFSRAVTSFAFTGSGDGGYYSRYSVIPQPQGTPELEFYLQSQLDYTPTTVSGNDKAVTSHIEVWKVNSGAQPTKIGTTQININSSASWTKGNNDGKTTGWDLARSKLLNAQPPTDVADLSESFHVNIPGADYNGSSAYYFSIDVDKDYVYAKNSLNQTVARITSNYKTGWTNAYGQASIPADTNTTNDLSISWPSNTPDGTANTRKYYMENNDDNSMNLVYVKSGGSKVTVARYTHNKYTAGWNAAAAKTQSKTLTWNTNGTYTLSADTGYVGLSSVKVTVSVSAPSVSSIDLGSIAVSSYQPTGYEGATLLTQLANSIKNNRNTYVWFKVKALNSSGGTLYTKNYYCASA